MRPEADRGLPLQGLVVLDMSHLAAGPWCTMMLADMGAEVVKVEPPGRGDISRSAGGVFLKGESAVFLGLNRNKRSMALNLQSPQGREIVHKLVARADVFVENFRPGTVERLGIDYGTLAQINPRLIYCSISAFGQSGPYRDRPAIDPIIQAMSGVISITGERGGGPVRVGVPLPDFAAGMMAAYGIMVALFHRERTGMGQKLELNLLDAQLFTLGPRAQEFLIDGQEQPPLGTAHPQFAPYQAFLCQGGQYLYIAAINDKFWQNLCQALGRPDLAAEARFATNPQRLQNRAKLTVILEEILKEKPREEWIKRLEAHEVPCGPVYSLAEAFGDPQVAHNEIVLSLQHPLIGELRTLGFPIKFKKTPARIRRAPPLLGQHTAEILAELGYTEAQIHALQEKGVAPLAG